MEVELFKTSDSTKNKITRFKIFANPYKQGV